MFLKVSKGEELGQLYWTKLNKQRSIIQMWSAWVLGYIKAMVQHNDCMWVVVICQMDQEFGFKISHSRPMLRARITMTWYYTFQKEQNKRGRKPLFYVA